MRLELILNKKRQKLSVKEGTTARDLVIRKKLSPEIVLVKINNRFCPLKTTLREGDKVEIIRVVFGG